MILVTDVALLLPFQWSLGTSTSGLWKPDMAAIFPCKTLFFFYDSLFKDVWPCECSYCALRSNRVFLTFFCNFFFLTFFFKWSYAYSMHLIYLIFKCNMLVFLYFERNAKNKSFWRINVFGFLEFFFQPILLNWVRNICNDTFTQTLQLNALWNTYPKQLSLN